MRPLESPSEQLQVSWCSIFLYGRVATTKRGKYPNIFNYIGTFFYYLVSGVLSSVSTPVGLSVCFFKWHHKCRNGLKWKKTNKQTNKPKKPLTFTKRHTCKSNNENQTVESGQEHLSKRAGSTFIARRDPVTSIIVHLCGIFYGICRHTAHLLDTLGKVYNCAVNDHILNKTFSQKFGFISTIFILDR